MTISPKTKNILSGKLMPNYKMENVGSVMLAKAYLSSKYSGKKDIYKEMSKDAKIRGHSVGVQQAIYTKTN